MHQRHCLDPQRRGGDVGRASSRREEIPDPVWYDDGVEDFLAERLSRRCVEEEPVQRMAGIGHLRERLTGEDVRPGDRAEQRRVDTGPGLGRSVGHERGPQCPCADCRASVRGRRRVRREVVERTAGIGAGPDDERLPEGGGAAETTAGAEGNVPRDRSVLHGRVFVRCGPFAAGEAPATAGIAGATTVRPTTAASAAAPEMSRMNTRPAMPYLLRQGDDSASSSRRPPPPRYLRKGNLTPESLAKSMTNV